MSSKHKKQAEAARRARRAEAQRLARARQQRRSRLISIGAAALAALLVAVFVIANVVRDDDGQTVSTDDTIPTSSTLAPMESAAGKPCVKRTGDLPAGAPDVPVKEGPPPTELIKEDLAEGTGETVEPGSTITVNYIGVACSTGVIFDSSYASGQPATFSLNGVIQGWTDGIPGMKTGGRRLLGIPSAQAYAERGSPPDIAPDEALWFVVEVVSISPPTTQPAMTLPVGGPGG